AGELSKINAWIGTAGTVTPCHYDSYDNLLTQVVGYKYIKLFAPSQTPLLYRSYLPWHLQRTWPTMVTCPPCARANIFPKLCHCPPYTLRRSSQNSECHGHAFIPA
ncbi:hypothetical protein CYMTET_34506, partial [Cymbomonas tetramitiformis]